MDHVKDVRKTYTVLKIRFEIFRWICDDYCQGPDLNVWPSFHHSKFVNLVF